MESVATCDLIEMIFTKRKDPLPATAAEIVAEVVIPVELSDLDRCLTALRARRDKISETIDAASTLKVAPSFFAAARRQKAETEREITATRQRHSVLWAEYEIAIREALAPHRDRTTARFDAALEALLSAWADLDEIASQITRIGIRSASRRLTVGQFQTLARAFIEAGRHE